MISLDLDLIKELNSVKNASKLINDFLLDYFKGGSLRKKTELEAKRSKISVEILELKEMIIIIDNKLLNLEKQEVEVKKTFDNMPRKLLEDFKEFPTLSEENLKNRYSTFYERYATWPEVLEAFKIYFKDRDDPDG